MSYVLAAVIARQATIEGSAARLVGSRVVRLEQGLGMIPVTRVLRDSQAAQVASPLDSRYGLFYFLPPQISAFCVQLSEQSPVAYVEADFFGGVGEQHCVVWKNGNEILGPLKAQDAINQALRLLAVEKQGFFDEFEALGLGQHRDTEDWAEETSRAKE